MSEEKKYLVWEPSLGGTETNADTWGASSPTSAAFDWANYTEADTYPKTNWEAEVKVKEVGADLLEIFRVVRTCTVDIAVNRVKQE